MSAANNSNKVIINEDITSNPVNHESELKGQSKGNMEAPNHHPDCLYHPRAPSAVEEDLKFCSAFVPRKDEGHKKSCCRSGNPNDPVQILALQRALGTYYVTLLWLDELPTLFDAIIAVMAAAPLYFRDHSNFRWITALLKNMMGRMEEHWATRMHTTMPVWWVWPRKEGDPGLEDLRCEMIAGLQVRTTELHQGGAVHPRAPILVIPHLLPARTSSNFCCCQPSLRLRISARRTTAPALESQLHCQPQPLQTAPNVGSATDRRRITNLEHLLHLPLLTWAIRIVGRN